MPDSYGSTYTSTPVGMLGIDARATFITRTYNHLLAAIIGFVLVEVFFFTTGLAEVMARAMLGVSWLLVLGGFVLVSWLASRAAHRSRSLGTGGSPCQVVEPGLGLAGGQCPPDTAGPCGGGNGSHGAGGVGRSATAGDA